jgi:hypothetical protein
MPRPIGTTKFTQQEIADILRDAPNMEVKDIATKHAVATCSVYYILKINGVKPKKKIKTFHLKKYSYPKTRYTPYVEPDPPKQKIIRPPAEYSNARSNYLP